MHKKSYILLPAAILFLFALGAFLFLEIRYIVALKNEGTLLRGELQTWVNRSKETMTLQNTLEDARKTKEQIENYIFIPTEENQIKLISDIENIIIETGSKGEVKSIDLSSNGERLIGSVTLSGSWNNVFHTLKALESYPIRLSLDDVSIIEEGGSVSTQKEEANNPTVMQYRVNLKFTILNVKKI